MEWIFYSVMIAIGFYLAPLIIVSVLAFIVESFGLVIGFAGIIAEKIKQ